MARNAGGSTLCTRKEIDRVAEAARAAGADVVVGTGGGTAIDTAKAVGHALGDIAIGRAATAEGETTHNMPFTVTPGTVADALLAGDAYARATAGKA
ncbi:iron-containing alcohol dehydrogenase [Streptomyces sp. NBC_00249]|uniref:iron-containing alcohol dehydrogenase n=1 Tax=Streptomyces sp. NBC_00249 TaxID=2975690 RepID=UPI0022574D2E|nr:iron-containing alcohol dehydrogenase [Streptomyces sp. NBC_00249]MCX5197088.1 iron-containing alcohol dehydrogenase [Streptomyces sp. NBC_00249]